jgi:hypothetical protein
MVERTEAKGFEEFNGKVDNIETVQSKLAERENQQQFKITISTIPATLTKTGKMYTWVAIPETANDEHVPQDSVIDKYIKALERMNPALKKEKSVTVVFQWLLGKSFQFSKEKLGKAYKGHEAAEYWVPIKEL